MSRRKNVLIIGGGISGLTSGIYAEQNGLHAVIVEKNASLGGFCAGWYRKGYYLDGCIHWLTGTRKGTILYDIWKNVGAFSNDEDIINLPSWGSFDYEGKTITFYSDLIKAESSWVKVAPEDKKEIKKFFDMIYAFGNIELPLGDESFFSSPKKVLKLVLSVLRACPRYLWSLFQSTEKYAKRFKNPTLRWAVSHAQPGMGNLYSLLYSYSTVAFNNGGIPKGGSLKLIENMKNKFLSLGGTIYTNSEVTNITIKNKQIENVIINNNKILTSDYYIAACETNYVLQKLLKNNYDITKYSRLFSKDEQHHAPSGVLVFLKANDIKLNVPSTSFSVEPFVVGNSLISHLTIRYMNYDPTYQYSNTSVIQVLLDQYSNDYSYWNNLISNRSEYDAVKKHIGEIVKSKIIKRYPILKDGLEVLDVSTPYTLHRYTNALRGEYMSYLFKPFTLPLTHNGKLRGLKNLFLSGQWLFTPGGLPIALVNGKNSALKIANYENRKAVLRVRRKTIAKIKY